jgi:hypothetical protein
MQADTDKAQPATAGAVQGDAASAPQDDAGDITTASPRATPPSVAPATPGSKTDPARATVFAARDDLDTADRWMSYAELAQARRTDKPSAVKLASRQHWRRRKNNQGVMQVLVPAKWAAPYWAAGAGPDMAPDVASISKADAAHDGGSAAARDASRAMDITHVLNTLDVAVAALRGRAEAAERRADAADTDRRVAQVRLEHAEAATAAERERAAAALADERAKADALRAQIDELNAEMVVARAGVDRALAEERQRADRLSDQVEALSAEVMRADAAGRDKERAEADRDAERARADTLRDRNEALQEQLAARQEGVDATEAIRQAEAMVGSLREAHAGEVSALKAERHRLATQIDGFATRADQAEARTDSLRARVDVLQRERDAARAEAQEAAQAGEALRLEGEETRKARGRLRRAWDGWRGR